MTIGVIGLGSIGERHVRNIQKMYPRFSIDILTSRTTWKDKGPRMRLVADAKDFYATKHDVYFVTNETAKHADTILTCLKQKPKGIFVEKPLCHTQQDITRIKKVLARSRSVLFVGYCLQFSKPVLVLKKMIKAGAVGNVLFIRASVGQDLRTWRKGDYTKHYSADSKRGGGAVLDLIHELNYPAWLLGEPLRFHAGFSGRISLPIRAEDMSEGIFRTKSGIVVSIHQDYVQVPGRRLCEIVGTKGTLVWEGDTRIISIRTATKKRTISVEEDRNRMYEKELTFFMKQVRAGKRYSNFDEAAQDLINADTLKSTYATH